MKKKIFFWLAIFAAALMFIFLGWAFAQHGTIGLFRVNGTFQKLFILLGVFGLYCSDWLYWNGGCNQGNQNAARISFLL